MVRRLGPDGKPLPDGLYWDGKRFRAWVAGMRSPVHAGKTIRGAKRKLRQLEREHHGIDPGSLSSFIEEWEADKIRTGRRNVKRERRALDRHVLPTLGRRRLDDITAPEVVDLAWMLYADGLGAKTVRNVLGSLSTVYELAMFRGLVEANPCRQIPHGKLPKPGHNPWRKYEAREVAALLHSPEVPEDRRVIYALMFWLALREGEACGLMFDRWSRESKPLATIVIDRQYDGEALKSSRDDYEAARRWPVSDELARTLAVWKLSGFARIFGRAPREDDFIVPSARTMRARTRNAVYKALVADEARIGIEHAPGRGTHGFRKAFVSTARAAGANPDVIRALTHTGRSRDVLDLYTQWPWETFCDAVRVVRLPELETNAIPLHSRKGG